MRSARSVLLRAVALRGDRMSLLTPQNLESELSYAYVHAVASRAGWDCQPTTRHADARCVDVRLLTEVEPEQGVLRTDVALNLQLKATRQRPAEHDGWMSFWLDDISAYDRLRRETVGTTLILVVLFLPDDELEWLAQSEAELALRRCAYWLSLRGAPPSSNTSGKTIHVPREQVFSVESLACLAAHLSRFQRIEWRSKP